MGETKFDPPNEADAKKLRALLRVLKLFRDVSPTIPISYAQAFLEVALNPGEGPSEYMKRMETIQPIMSRILLALGAHPRYAEDGLELLDTANDPIDLRRKRSFVTPKGQRLVKAVLKELEKAQ